MVWWKEEGWCGGRKRKDVDFLSNQEQDPARSAAVVSFHALHQHVMVRHDNDIQPALHRGLGDVFVCTATVRVTGVHVQIDNDFVHKILCVDYFPYSQV